MAKVGDTFTFRGVPVKLTWAEHRTTTEIAELPREYWLEQKPKGKSVLLQFELDEYQPGDIVEHEIEIARLERLDQAESCFLLYTKWRLKKV